MADQTLIRFIQINPHSGRGSFRIPVARLFADDGAEAAFAVDWIYDFDRSELGLLEAVGTLATTESVKGKPDVQKLVLPLADGRVITTEIVKGQKSFNGAGFVVEVDDSIKAISVYHKSGVVEVFKHLDLRITVKDQEVKPYILARYVLPTGQFLYFDWTAIQGDYSYGSADWLYKGSKFKLAAISDSRGYVLKANWAVDEENEDYSKSSCELVLYPDSDEQITYQCTFNKNDKGAQKDSPAALLTVTGSGILGKAIYRLTHDSSGKLATFEADSVISVPADTKDGKATTEISTHCESITYKDAKIATCTVAPGGGLDVLIESYSYDKNKTTVSVSQGSEKDKDGKSIPKVICNREYQFKDGIQVSESNVINGVTYATEQSVTTDKARAVAVVKTTQKVAGAVVDEITLEYSADGNLLSSAQGGQITEFTYFNNYQNYSVKEVASRYEDTSFFGFLLKPFEYFTFVGIGNAIFGASGLTWGTHITSTVEMGLTSNNYAKDAFNLPVAINYPGDVRNFSSHVESMLVSREDGDKKHAISLTYFGYEAFTPLNVEGLVRKHVVRPARKLTVVQPGFSDVDISAEQLKVAKAAAQAFLDSLAKQKGSTSSADEKKAYQASIDDLNKSLEAQSKANARGFKLNSPWPDGCMQVEELAYHSDGTKAGFGQVKSTTTVLLDGKGKEIAASKTVSSFEYSVDAKDARRLTVTTTVKTADELSITSSVTRSGLTGRRYESVNGDGIQTVHTYNDDLSGKTTIKRDTTVLEEATHSVTALKDKRLQYQSHSTVSKEHHRFICDELGREVEHLVSNDGKTWLKMETCTYESSGRAQLTSEFDYDLAGKKINSRLTTWSYDDQAGSCTATIVLKDASDKEVDRQVQVVERTANTHSLTLGTFKVLQEHDFASNTLTETFGQLTDAHYKQKQVFDRSGQLLTSTSISVGKDKKETELDRMALSYDPLGQLQKVAPKNDHTITYSYDPYGRLLTSTTNGIVIGNGYSGANLSSVAVRGYAKDSVGETELGTQTVDGLGRVSSQTLDGIKHDFTYSGVSSLAKHSGTGDGPGTLKGYESALASHGMDHSESVTTNKVVHKTRTLFSRRATVVEFEGLLGGKTHYNYDALGRLVKSANTSCEATFTYLDNGLISQETIKALKPGLTMTVTYGYDVMGHETSRKFVCEGFDPIAIERTLLSDGRLTKSSIRVKDKERHSDSYEYDASDRLKRWSCTGDGVSNHEGKKYVSESFEYDALGDVLKRQNESYKGDTRPEKLTSDTSTYGYDASKPGAMIMSGTSTMVEDEAGRLIKRVNRDITYYPNGQVKTYSATADGKGGDYVFAYDDMRRIRGGTAGSWTDTYHYRGDWMYAVVQTDSASQFGFTARTLALVNESSSCLMQDALTTTGAKSAESSSFELRDAAGSIIASLDLQKKAITWYLYSPFGYRNPDRAAVTWLGFKGEPLNMLSLYHLGNGYRLYDPQLHRFQTPDSKSPFGRGGASVYAFCSCDPVNYHDHSGHQQVAQYGRLDSAPWMYSTGFRIAMGVINVLSAPFTAGASLALMLATTGLAVISLAFDVASILLEESDPQLAKTLEYIGIGAGIASAITGLAAMKAGAKLSGGAGRVSAVDDVIGKNRSLGHPTATGSTTATVSSGSAVPPFYFASSGPTTTRLIVHAHGAPVRAPGVSRFFSTSIADKVGFYANDRFTTRLKPTGYHGLFDGSWLPKNYYSGTGKIPNYELGAITEQWLTDVMPGLKTVPNFRATDFWEEFTLRYGVDFATPMTTTSITLEQILTTLETAGYRYTHVDVFACRGTLPGSITPRFIKSLVKDHFAARDLRNGALAIP